MSLVFDRRAELGDQPGTHALLCGVSAYPHLPGGDGEQVEASVGFLRQLSTPARTTLAIAKWLEDHCDDLVPPLATCRLLAAPAPSELSADDAGALTDDQLPTLDHFLRAAKQWRDDASTNPDGMTIFYIAGLGFADGRANQVLLLRDFANGLGSVLRNTVSIESIWQGMAASERFEKMARKQLYFIDSGHADAPLSDEILLSRATDVFDPPLVSSENRAAITFHAAAKGQQAYAPKDRLTIFGDVLLAALDGGATEKTDDGWAITTHSLISYIPDEVRQRLLEHDLNVQQDVVVGGVIRAATIVNVPIPPLVEVQVEVPEALAETASISIQNASLEEVLTFDAPFPDSVVNFSVPAGIYLIKASAPGDASVTQFESILPSSKRMTIDLQKM